MIFQHIANKITEVHCICGYEGKTVEHTLLATHGEVLRTPGNLFVVPLGPA